MLLLHKLHRVEFEYECNELSNMTSRNRTKLQLLTELKVFQRLSMEEKS